ncbi:hypothetical protein [Stackebrandtia nassauensis]|uniref:Uncharacterized protein n=1 Tax=Stackebrandtia nassauensis (strain DSM 44728 / CIP 108903 / NRRL B-16338 / NBRC 102104 / LLR-40K-21) TaxID=446470 RepID=D3PWP9_STANL|nr:hypothetical protein [Stackebrandtia nassauensis]ADD43271.1 hypothetical protein Snas_3611 [Stackebrandtia nassauensis DSM 44728]
MATPRNTITRDIDGEACTDFDGVCAILDRAPSTVRTYIPANPDLLAPVRNGTYIDGRKWYRLTGVHAFADILAAKTHANKPLSPTPGGDPEDMLSRDQVAHVWHASPTTITRYANKARHQWIKRHPRPLMPPPRAGYDPDHPYASGPAHWEWRRRDIVEHPRPGRGAAGGRRPSAPAPPPPTAPEALLDYRQAAHVQGIPVATMRTKLARAKPQWIAQHPAPSMPPPDHGFDIDNPDASKPSQWRWYRRTIDPTA